MPSDLRSTGRYLAAVAFTVVAGVIVWSVTNQRRGAAPAAPSPSLPSGTASPPASTTRPGSGLIAGSDKGTWTRANPDTGVIESRLDYQRLVPLEGGRYEIESPGAWLYSNGVPRLHVGAPTARVIWTARDEPPEAGDLTGGVTVRVFPAPSAPPRDNTTPPLDSALYTIRLDSVHFEGALSQLESSDPLVVRGPGLAAEGTGLLLRFSPATSKLEYIRTLGKSARIDPVELRRGIDALNGPRRPRPEGDEQAGGHPPSPAVLDAYELLLADTLRGTQGTRTVEAGALRIWAMLQDGRLADGAFAPFESPDSATSPEAAQGQNRTASKHVPSDDAPIEITWAGPLEIRSLPNRPPELKADLLRARFDAATPAPAGLTGRPDRAPAVVVADARHGVEIRAGSIDYGATSRTLSVTGIAEGKPFLARAGGADSGTPPIEMRADALTLDLTTGVGAVPGPGTLSAPQQPPGSDPTLVTWRRRTDFELDTTTGPAGAGGVVLPARVTLSGSVRVTAPEGTASAEMADLRFRRVSGPSGSPASIPAQAVLDGAAEARTSDGVVKAERLTVVFHEQPDARGRAVARAASGRGNASAERTTDDGIERIEAQAIDAVLVRDDPSGRVSVTTLTAESRVVFSGKDGLRATADRLDADAVARTASLVGSQANPASISSGMATATEPSAAAQRLTAERIRLDGAARRVHVPGPGVATSAGDGRDGPQTLGVEWSREMTYSEDESGKALADIIGRVVAVGVSGVDHYKAGADRARVRLSNNGGRSTVEEVTLERTGADRGGSNFVEADARRLRDGADPRQLEGLVNLRGPALSVFPAERAMRVPGPGRIVIDDRRGGGSTSPPTAEGETAFENLRGKSVIEWTGSLDTLRPSGTLRLEQGVRVRHLPPGATEAMLLEASSLALDLAWPAETDAEQEPRLVRISADGGVFVKHPRARLVGSSLAFDAETNLVLVAGSADRPVTVEDLESGATTTARGVRFDPRNGTWQAADVGTITVPR